MNFRLRGISRLQKQLIMIFILGCFFSAISAMAMPGGNSAAEGAAIESSGAAQTPHRSASPQGKPPRRSQDRLPGGLNDDLDPSLDSTGVDYSAYDADDEEEPEDEAQNLGYCGRALRCLGGAASQCGSFLKGFYSRVKKKGPVCVIILTKTALDAYSISILQYHMTDLGNFKQGFSSFMTERAYGDASQQAIFQDATDQSNNNLVGSASSIGAVMMSLTGLTSYLMDEPERVSKRTHALIVAGVAFSALTLGLSIGDTLLINTKYSDDAAKTAGVLQPYVEAFNEVINKGSTLYVSAGSVLAGIIPVGIWNFRRN